MDEKYISTNHIQKLAHKIQEIRERALFLIISKLDNGFKFDNELARSRELLTNLLHWFLFEPCTYEDHVLNLIKKILQSEAGRILISHCGKTTIRLELDKIRTFINPKYYSGLDEVVDILETQVSPAAAVVPPLRCEVPLSYRSNCSDNYSGPKTSPLVGSTASVIQGFIQKGSSYEQQIGPQETLPRSEDLLSENPTFRIDTGTNIENKTTSRLTLRYTLKWQPLIETDRHVLQSVENSVRNPQEALALFHSCEFFINVLLQDFPAEIFIQRPGIISAFYDLIYSCQSTKLSNIILECLYNLTKALQIRINHYNDSCMQNLKTEILPLMSLPCTSSSSNRHSNTNEESDNENFEKPEDTTVLKNNQFTIPDYCFRTMNVILKCMTLKQESLSECKPKLNQIGINISLKILDEIINLLYQIVGEDLWRDRPNTEILAVFKEFNNSLSIYGDALEYFRLESLSLESDLKCRVIYLHLLCTCAKWLKKIIPLSKTKLVLPKNFKLSITNSLLDVSLGRLYPKVHKCLLEYVESFSSAPDFGCIKKYRDVMKICDGLSATVKFIKDYDNFTTYESIRLANLAIPSLEFHRNFEFLKLYIKLCTEKLYAYRDNRDLTILAEDITVRLMAHHLPEIQEEFYRLCYEVVKDNIGTKINLSVSGTVGPQIYFLLSSKILMELTLFGLKNENVKNYAEDILLYILKCKIIVSDDIWNKCIEALIPTLSFIICWADNNSALGRTIVNISDPDSAKTLALPDIVMIKSNVELLFSRDSYLREEAFSRICWLMASQENSREILPKFNTIYDKGLSNACNIKKIIDVNKIRRSEHFYQPSSLEQVLDLLRSPNVEPVIRRSALNQVSVMMEDNLLHDVFLDSHGLELMIEIMQTALKERNFRDYPDSIIPIVSILKSIALYHSSVREELSLNIEVIYYTLRGLFLFFTDDRIRNDASVLLFLLTFKDCIIGSPSRANFSIPKLIHEKLFVPFVCSTHMEISEHLGEDLYLMEQPLNTKIYIFFNICHHQEDFELEAEWHFFATSHGSDGAGGTIKRILRKASLQRSADHHILTPEGMFDFCSNQIPATLIEDKWSLSSIQVQWNSEIYGGFNNLVKLENSDLLNGPSIETPDILILNSYDLNHIKSSSLHHCIKKYLYHIQNATSHDVVVDCINKLTLYINLYSISTQLNEGNSNDQFLTHPWEKSFTRFIEVLPSSEEDARLLLAVLKFLTLLITFYKSPDNCWISNFLKNPSHCLLDILSSENTADEDTKILSQELLKLITLCVVREQHFLDYYNASYDVIPTNSGWNHVIRSISDNLQFNNTQHFYNLAYLDALLSCLVHLTATLGWSNSKAGTPPKEPLPHLILSLCELLTAFHCGKGPTAAVSVMGLSISRNVMLVLNHLLAEMRCSKVKRWEHCFFEVDDETTATRSFLALWASRDVVLRAAALQLFSNLTSSPRAAEEIINDLKHDNGNIWELTFKVLISHTEAGIVRENAALLLANLSNNISAMSDSKTSVLLSVSSCNVRKQDFALEILNLLEEFDFYYHLEVILTSLFTLNYMTASDYKETNHFKYSDSEKTSSASSGPPEIPVNITTPGLIKAICIFLSHLVDLVPKEVCSKLYERGLVKLLFRTLCDPAMAIDNTRELALYCNLLEMDSSVCKVLKKMCSLNSLCIGTLLHTKDCLNVLFSLLNTKKYHTHLSQLVYLRNILWSEIFNLVAVLLDGFNEENMQIGSKNIESLSIISQTIADNGTEIFLDALCESISCIGTNGNHTKSVNKVLLSMLMAKLYLQNSSLVCLISILRIECHIALESPCEKLSLEHSLENLLDTVRTPRTVLMSSFRENIENFEPPMKTPSLTKKTLQKFEKYKNNLLEETYFGKIIQRTKPDSIDDIEVSFIDSHNDSHMAGAELCKILLYLYEISNIKIPRDSHFAQKKELVVSALTGILCISHEAKNFALKQGLMEIIIKELRDYHIKLSLESVDSLRRVQDKKRLCPVLKEINNQIGLITNFMLNSEKVKMAATDLNFADVIHKLWIWFSFQNSYVVDVLRMLCVYTFECSEACRSLPLTSSVAGSGPRKTPSNVSLLHVVISVIVKEMDQMSKSHDLLITELAFDILHHCCDLLECRVIITKSNLFQAISRLHPAVTKRQYPWESVELLWLEFLQTYTRYPEGQTAVAKGNDILELVISLTSSSKLVNRQEALLVLRNLAFYQPNRPRLLSSGDFLSVLQSKLTTGTNDEKKTAVIIMWSLAANNQKAKLIFKSAKLDLKLENTIKYAELLGDSESILGCDDLKMMHSVLGILRGNDKVR